MTNFVKPVSGALRGTAAVGADIPVFTSTLTGVVPASGGGTTNFLRADGTWTTTPGSGTATPTASTNAQWDANVNMSANAFIPGYATTATVAGTTTLSVISAGQQYFTGTSTQTVKLPSTSGLVTGQQYLIVNTSTGNVTVQTSTASPIVALAQNTEAIFTVISTLTNTPSGWAFQQVNVNNQKPPTIAQAPTDTVITSTGTQTGWLFTTSTAATVSVGDTYTNNGNTFTVQVSLAGSTGQVLWMSGTGSTTTTGTDTLTRATGSGSTTITFNGSTKLATATYTTPSNPAPLYINVRAVGGGGGGAGGGTGPGSGTNGADSWFAGGSVLSSVLDAGGGGSGGGTSGNAGNASGGDVNIGGQFGAIASLSSSATSTSGGFGGGSLLGLGGTNAGANAPGRGGTGYGAGGGSGGSSIAAGQFGGGGGGYVEKNISNPAASYPYIVGTGGSAGAAGTAGQAGAAGTAGIIIIREYYQ